MPFFKTIVMGVTCYACLASVSHAQDDQRLTEEQIQESIERAKRISESVPFAIPEAEKEKMRQALSGEGDYALPAPSIEQSTMPEAERANIQSILQRMESEKELMRERGVFDGLDEQTQRAKARNYEALSREVAKQSQSGLEQALQEHARLEAREASAFTGGGDPTQTNVKKTGESAIFVSFSMPEAALREAFVRAKQQNAQVYFKGMHPAHSMINETMGLVRRIGADIESPPMTRFNPNAFEEYGVTQVPTIFYRDKDSIAVARGILNLNYVKDKAESSEEDLDLGAFGPTSEVIEKSIIQEFQERIARIDWEKKQARAVDNFWVKKQFHTIPAATKDETFFIDPTVQAQADIKTPHGELLARQGQVINPLRNRSMGITILVFDATSNRQVEWVTKQLASGELVGNVMIMTTQLQRQQGWDHLSALHEHFNRPIYMVPKELVERFKLTGTPALITTELKRELMKVQQFNLNGVQG